MRPDSLLRLWRYINHLLTYLLTYSYITTASADMSSTRFMTMMTIILMTVDNVVVIITN